MTKNSVDGTETGTVSVTLDTINVTWAMMVRLTKGGDGAWQYAAATGTDDTTGASYSVTYSSDLDLKAGDLLVIGVSVPTDVTTPRQFTAMALSATGITFGEVMTCAEPD